MIVAAIDLKEKTERTLQVALALARDAGATVEIVHMAPEGYASPVAPEIEVERALAAAATAGALVVERQQPGSLEVLNGGEDVATMVRRVALQKRADLVVIGRGHVHGSVFERLHAHSYSVICESPCPVMSV